MTNQDIFTIIDLKSIPIETPTVQQWSELEPKVLFFPEDYKSIISQYGTGVLAEFFCIWNPFSNRPNMNWLEEKDSTITIFRNLISQFPTSHEGWKLYPETGGLLPFGHTANGDTLFWLTEGDPNQWALAVAREAPLGIYKEPLCSFLFNVLTKQNYCNKFPDLSDSPRVFEPYTQS